MLVREVQRGLQRQEIVARHRLAAPPRHVVAAPFRRDRRHHVVVPELAEIFDGIGERVGAHHGRRVLAAVERKSVGYPDLSRITAAEFRLVLSSEVVSEGFFGVRPEFLSPCATWRRCARLALDATSAGIAVEDDPSVGFSRPPWFSELDSGAFVGTAHFFLMSSMLASVVNILPAIISARRLPRSISRRRPDTPTLPSGNAICAAMLRRSGVVAVIVSGNGTRFGVFGLCFRGCLMEQPSLSAASASVIRPSRRSAVLVSVTLRAWSCCIARGALGRSSDLPVHASRIAAM